MKTMRVMEATGAGLDHLELVERPVPEPGPGEAQVRIRAATLNYRDALIIEGRVPVGRATFVPLSCGCGEVTAVGPDVTRVRVGERVAPTFFQGWVSGPWPFGRSAPALGGPVDGVAREFACFREDGLVKVPDSLSDLEAATLPCAGLTAWNGLFVCRATRPGDVVLLQGTGGVSVAGLQLAKAAGAVVVITSSSDAKLARARSLGADHVINYRAVPRWGERARDLTGGRGVDVVLEVGGSETIPQSLSALRRGADIAAIGLLAGTPAWQVDVPEHRLHRIRVGNGEQFDDMLRGIQATGIRPVVDRAYPLGRLADAVRALRTGAMFGKIGIDVTQ